MVVGVRAPAEESPLRARARHRAGPRLGRKEVGPCRERAANTPPAGGGCKYLMLAGPRCGYQALLPVALLKRKA